jgi:formylglycine-generating enzyme required for sulfatase activity/N-acetylneuraminic acid mutarotase
MGGNMERTKLMGLVVALVIGLVLGGFVSGYAETDVTSKVQVIKSALSYDRLKKQSYLNVSVKNISNDVLLTPIKVVIDSVSPSTVTVANADGVTAEGKPYIAFSTASGQFLPGATITAKKLSFSNSTAAKFSYITTVRGNIPEAAKLIGPEGGEVVVANSSSPLGGVEIEALAGSFPSGATVIIAIKDPPVAPLPEGVVPDGPCISFESSSQFQQPVYIKIPFKGDRQEDEVRLVYTFNEITREWELVTPLPTPDPDLFLAEVNHFSTYVKGKAKISGSKITTSFTMGRDTLQYENEREYSCEYGESGICSGIGLLSSKYFNEWADNEKIGLNCRYDKKTGANAACQTFGLYSNYPLYKKATDRISGLLSSVFLDHSYIIDVIKQNSKNNKTTPIFLWRWPNGMTEEPVGHSVVAYGINKIDQYSGEIDIYNVNYNDRYEKIVYSSSVVLGLFSRIIGMAYVAPDNVSWEKFTLDTYTNDIKIDSVIANNPVSGCVDPANIDNDQDGFTPDQGDCNDTNPSLHPGASEICGDGIDQDCSGADEVCAVPPPGAIYSDDFSNGNNLDDYQIVVNDTRMTPNWRIENGKLTQDAGNDHNFLLIKDMQHSNQVISTDVSTHDTGGYGGVVFWYHDAANWASVYLYPADQQTISVYSSVNGTIAQKRYPFTCANNTVYRLQVLADSDAGKVTVFVNGSQQFEHTITATYRSGLTGLNSGNAGATFDNFSISPLLAQTSNSLGMTFNEIPAGTFIMGSPDSEPGRTTDEGPQHQVTISKPFSMQTTEVTQGQWRAVMGNNPSWFATCGDTCPVTTVSLEDVQQFIAKMNQRGEGTYRLPTEAEWEYAARAGSTTAFVNGGITASNPDSDPDLNISGGYTPTASDNDPNLNVMGWYIFNSGNMTHPVAQKQPNFWGLYDMHGNVWEMVQDYWGSYTSAPVTDPQGPTTASQHNAVRGGSWARGAALARSASRALNYAPNRSNDIGFRLVLTSSLPTPSAGSFTATGSMNNTRYHHTATLLPDGKVLIAGGVVGRETPVMQAELYDPQTGTFSVAGSLNVGRYFHRATMLQNNKVLLTGGYRSINSSISIYFNSAELYDPITGSFQSTGNMNFARRFHTSTLLNNGMVLITGGTGNGGTYLDSAELYDPATNQFTLLNSKMHMPRDGHTATLLENGMVLIVGGNANGILAPYGEIYDPATENFTIIGNMVQGRTGHTSVKLSDGTVLIAGGSYNNMDWDSPTVSELYNPNTNSFSPVGPIRQARTTNDSGGVTLPNGNVLIVGGAYFDKSSNLWTYRNSTEIYNHQTGLFSDAASMSIARHGHSVTVLGNGKVLVAGGIERYSGSNGLSSAELFTP